MGQLPRPVVPDGPIRAFFDDLHDLHHRAGWPSLRDMAREVGCSHTTISVAFSAATVPRWGLVELIVEALGGDTGHFHTLWLAAGTTPEPQPTPGFTIHSAAPRQLPGDVAAFTGREEHLDALDRRSAEVGADSAVAISVVTGTAGVGKTALAVHWAHRAASRFPDGQLYLNLRGYGPDQPVDPAAALETMLGALGVDRSAVPHGVEERAALYRTLLAGRRMLILLDNAHSVAQVRDLVPGTSTCQVLVTSRDMLAALVARYGATRVGLDVLTLPESIALLRRLLGIRVDHEPDEAAALARGCDRLPLAIRIAAELAAARPTAPLSWLVAGLADEARKLDLLAAGDDIHTAVRSVFSWSCRHLAPEVLAAFELLGLHSGPAIQVGVAAALFDTDLPQARSRLETLARAHLVTETRPGWFGRHDLLRAYAAERAAARADGAQARHRLYDHYVRAARAAVDTGDSRDGWLVDEHANLLAIAAAAVNASPAHTIDLSACLARHFDLRAYYRDGITVHELALRAARGTGDRVGEAAALNWLGTAWMRSGCYPRAATLHQDALAISQDIGELAEEGNAHHGLGVVSWRLGRYDAAREHLSAALAIRQRTQDRREEATALYGLGSVHQKLGDHPAALDHQRRALEIFRQCGDRTGESRVLNNLGATLERMGRHDDALDHYGRALALNRVIGNRVGEAVALSNLGCAASRLGRHADAIDYHEQALPLYVDIGYRVGEAHGRHAFGAALQQAGRLQDAVRELRLAIALARDIGEADAETGSLVDLGETLRAAGDPDAGQAYRSALELALRTGDRYEQARALSGLAHLDLTSGEPDSARKRWHDAEALFAALGVPEAGEVHGYLAGLVAVDNSTG